MAPTRFVHMGRPVLGRLGMPTRAPERVKRVEAAGYPEPSVDHPLVEENRRLRGLLKLMRQELTMANAEIERLGGTKPVEVLRGTHNAARSKKQS